MADAPSTDEIAEPAISNEVWANLTIHERMLFILGDLPAIGKNQRNEQQKFNFRGIDDVLNALNPLLAKWGVYYVPRVVDRISETRTSSQNKPINVVHLHVVYTFTGAKGDSIQSSCWGEGTDSGDKATNKAMTSAMKYVLFQAFAISTEEASTADSDRYSEEAADAKANAKQAFYTLFDTDDPQYTAGWASFDDFDKAHVTYAAGMQSMEKAKGEKVKAWRREQGIGWPMSNADYERCIDYIASLNMPDEAGTEFAPSEEATKGDSE